MSGLVKHFQNDMKNIPQLSNNWGSMINLLDKVLVEGFNFVPVISVVKSSSDAITATISLGSGHGFIDRQVVRIAGSTNGWDGDYKVLSANTDSVVVECAATNPIAINGAASCSTAPLDFEIVFRTPAVSTEPKRAYQSKDPESLGLILLVHDFCVSGAAATGAKFAKVGVVLSMSDIDTITGTQMPYDSSKPGANWGWDGTYHGWAKWYYANPSYTYNYDSRADTFSPSSGNRGFNLVGDATSFIINISENMCSSLFGCVELFDPSFRGKNVCLLANGANTSPMRQDVSCRGSGRQGYAQTMNDVSYLSDLTYNQRGIMWFDTQGVYNPMILGRYYMPVFQGSPTWGQISGAESSNQHIFLQELIVDYLNNFRGVLPFLRKPTRKSNETIITEEGKTLVRYYSDYGRYWFGLCLESR